MPREHVFQLYPPIEPYETGFLAAGPLHRVYWEQSGNPEGIPVVFLHGGPGAGASPIHRRFFDPRAWRIIILDQRGCGRSSPAACITANTTRDLIADLEALRRHLAVPAWVLFGGSWGSTLALAYAQAHPSACLALVLRGVFLARAREIDWFLHGMGRFFPEARRDFLGHLTGPERGDPLAAYYQRLIDPDPAVHVPAAQAWSRYEAHCSILRPNPESLGGFGDIHAALCLARLEAHYFRHGMFLAENELLDNMSRIRHLPGAIVQGRYDVVCPIESADDLAAAWSRADYQVIPDAGHSALEPGVLAALLSAVETLKVARPWQ